MGFVSMVDVGGGDVVVVVDGSGEKNEWRRFRD